MNSKITSQMTDSRHLSPQTTSSSGYHSDLSLTNDSPQSIKENQSNPVELNENKPTKTKNLTRISTFLRKQYERAKSKFTSKKPAPSPVKTCSKATSTTPSVYLSDNNPISLPSSVYTQSSFIEPPKLHSIQVYPSYNKKNKISSENYASIHDCFTPRYQPRRLLTYSFENNNNNSMNSHSHQQLRTKFNCQNYTKDGLLNNSRICNRSNYSTNPKFCQSYYPYKYLAKNYKLNCTSYAPLSDFISTKPSAFKPIKSNQRPSHNKPDLIGPSDDPCDLEVAHYFHHTTQWSNPNYFDIYLNEISSVSTRENLTETLC